MERDEQRKLIRELKDYTSRMRRKDLELYEMLAKRDRDDEDLDALSNSELERLAATYVKRATKADADELWRKLTAKK